MEDTNPIAIDAQDLQYYDRQIKKYIDSKNTESFTDIIAPYVSNEIDRKLAENKFIVYGTF